MRKLGDASVSLVAMVLLTACAAPAGPGGTSTQPGPSQTSGPKRIVVSVTSDLPVLRAQMNRAAGGALAGAVELEQLVNAGLTIADDRSVIRPELAEEVPSVEKGSWRVFDGGRMETTWRIRDGASWHDGVPYTSADLVFSAQVMQDPTMPDFRTLGFRAVESVAAPDPRTFVITWSQPFIGADQTFGAVGSLPALPIPKHLLEQTYIQNKAGFLELPYWSEQFVGAGPFKLKDFVRGSLLVLEANDHYVLGRPKIDQIEVRFNPDPTTLVVALLSGALDQPIGRGVAFEQGLELEPQWRTGKVTFAPGSGVKVWPQLLNPRPAVISDVRFRRAVYQAIDRQQISDALLAGKGEVAHTIVTPGDREFPYVADAAVKYAFDPGQTAQALQGLGYVLGPDGKYRDSAAQPLVIELRSSPMDLLRKTKLAIADNWERAGIAVSVVDDSPQQRGDNEYRATFPGFDISRASSGVDAFQTLHSSQARTPQSRYVGENGPNLISPEFDALIERFLTTIPFEERMRVAGDMVYAMTDQVIVLDQFYESSPTAVANRILNVPPKPGRGGTLTWNVHLWDVQQ